MLDSPRVREYAVAVHANHPSPTHEHPSTLPAHGVPPRPSREVLLVVVFILFNSLSFFLMQYDRMRTASADLEAWVRSILSGVQPAPDQYSVAIPFLAQFLQVHAHLGIRQSLPLIEFLSYAVALTLLYLLFRSSPHVVHARPLNRLVLVGFFLTVAQFPILWIFPWDRPETLLTAFYLAAIVLLVVQRSRVRFGIVCLLTVLLSLGQALVQADVPVTVGVAIFLSVAVAVPFRRPRAQMAILGALSVAAGAAVQLLHAARRISQYGLYSERLESPVAYEPEPLLSAGAYAHLPDRTASIYRQHGSASPLSPAPQRLRQTGPRDLPRLLPGLGHDGACRRSADICSLPAARVPNHCQTLGRLSIWRTGQPTTSLVRISSITSPDIEFSEHCGVSRSRAQATILV